MADKLHPWHLLLCRYLGVGDNYGSDNLINIAAVLFMWCTLPAFGAAAYVPSLVLGKMLCVASRWPLCMVVLAANDNQQ
jgi:ATP-binding cassette, subfamily G (WHITE), member 2